MGRDSELAERVRNAVKKITDEFSDNDLVVIERDTNDLVSYEHVESIMFDILMEEL